MYLQASKDMGLTMLWVITMILRFRFIPGDEFMSEMGYTLVERNFWGNVYRKTVSQ